MCVMDPMTVGTTVMKQDVDYVREITSTCRSSIDGLFTIAYYIIITYMYLCYNTNYPNSSICAFHLKAEASFQINEVVWIGV